MEISGIAEVQATPAGTWAALNDPVVLAQCVSGCDSFNQVGPQNYSAVTSVKLGPVRSRITVNITFTESDPPQRAVLTMQAKGSIGSAEAIVHLNLHPSERGTHLHYRAQAKLGGQLGRFAKHWGRDAAEELVREFFRRFAAAVPPEIPVPNEPPARYVAPKPVPLPQPTMRKKALWIGIGAAAGAAVTAAAALVLTRRGSR